MSSLPVVASGCALITATPRFCPVTVPDSAAPGLTTCSPQSATHDPSPPWSAAVDEITERFGLIGIPVTTVPGRSPSILIEWWKPYSPAQIVNRERKFKRLPPTLHPVYVISRTERTGPEAITRHC